MAWIESHQGLERHPKTVRLMELMGWNLDETVGKLHRFWWWCVDYCEDGNLAGYNNTQLGFAVGIQGEEETRVFVENMVTARWLDRKPYFRVHNWWKYIGYFLQVKYKANPERWKSIRGRYIDNRLPAGEDGQQTPEDGQQAGKDDNGCNNPPNNGCKGGSNNGCLGGSLNSIPKPLPIPLKEGGKGTIPRAGDGKAEANAQHPTSNAQRRMEDRDKSPPVVASHGGEDRRQTPDAGRQTPDQARVQTGPRKFVNEIIRQKKELQAELLRMQHAYPKYSEMPKDKQGIYQEIKKKMRQLDKELLEA